MNRIQSYFHKNKDALSTRTARVGGYSFVVSAFVLAILIALNIAVSSLPSTWINRDISASQLYSVTSSTKAVAQKLDKEVTIYWITQSGKEDSVIEKLLGVYDSLSSNITVVKKNPDVYPTFAAKYTDETVKNNSLIVECGEKYRFIPYSDIYTSSGTSSYYYTSAATDFDGEGAITTAIDYVISDDLPIVYLTTGHGEAALSDAFSKALNKQNYETADFSLLTVDEIPEDAAAVLIHAPTSDISEEEASMLSSYLEAGGKLLVISGPQQEGTLENLTSLLTAYGVTPADGIVVEGDRSSYAFGAPYVLLPQLGDSQITSELKSNNSYIVLPIAQGLTVGSSSSGAAVTKLLTTSSDSFSKASGYDMNTYEKEENDTDGPFALAVEIDTASGGSLIWIASDNIMDATYNSYSAGANSDFTMNALSLLVGETDSISIRSKSLEYSYLTMNTDQAAMLKICLLAVMPLIFLVFGIQEVISRKKVNT